jgi:hypothetical protein
MSSVMKWDKDCRGWLITYTKDAVNSKNCPNCKGVVLDSNKEELSYSERITMDKGYFKGCLNFTCRKCSKQFKLPDFPEVVQDFWLNRVFNEIKNLATHPVPASISDKKARSIEAGVNVGLGGKVAVSGGTSAIEVKCGNVKCKKPMFTITDKFDFPYLDEENRIVQCFECGYYNKIPHLKLEAGSPPIRKQAPPPRIKPPSDLSEFF